MLKITLGVLVAVLSLVLLFMMWQLQVSTRRLDDKIKELTDKEEKDKQDNNEALTQATLAAAQQAAWDAAWARRLASRPIHVRLSRPKYHHHHPELSPPPPEEPAEEPVEPV
jgi:Na+-transporting methylmalonyl-CoA/oxaloacetate decarboxylase gamma subunit